MAHPEGVNPPSQGYLQERIDPKLVQTLEKAHFVSFPKAILDLVDNAWDARSETGILFVQLEYSPAKGDQPDCLRLYDQGGQGMNLAEMETFCTIGASGKEKAVGRFGYGGWLALSNLANDIKITFSKQGELAVYQVEIPKNDQAELGQRLIEYQQIGRNLSGFVDITMSGLKRTPNLKETAKEIAEIYRLPIKKRQMAVRVDGDRIMPLEIPLEGEKNDFSFTLIDEEVTGWYGQLADDAEEISPGIRIMACGRLIDLYLFDFPTHPALKRLTGECNLESGQIPISLDKTKIIKDNPSWKNLQDRLHRLMEPFIMQLIEEYKEGRVPHGHKPAYNQALNVVRQTLVELGELTHGIKKPKERKAKDFQAQAIEKRRPYQPRTPAPPEAVGQRQRLPHSGIIRIISRNLGSEEMSELHTDEEGHKILVICPNHPAYRAAQKDHRQLVRHLLACAANELAMWPPTTDPEITPDQYEIMAVEYRENLSPEKYKKNAERYLAKFTDIARKQKMI